MLKKLLVALITGAFALSVYAQAPKSGTEKAAPKGQTGVTTEKAEPGKGQSATKGDKKAPKKTAKTKAKKDDAKDSRKAASKTDAKAKADTKKDAKAATK